ncbi:protein ENHANCED DOWNY MILDEW 2-like [Mercurialis annua]|uniref:protein ENHANCED DOWNY MILDEW 2-like n=1 Tax=Mercurialis annua TaxID=3986 RepID=UPI0024AD379C|nr:protein ENHANCED DOWNY MILDEW 2-like [Mercurialis annua]
MASSDDEAEVGVIAVSNYHFVDDEDEPISFSTLPFQWSEKEGVDEKNKYQIFLHGSANSGLRTVHVGVIAWKFDLLNANPEISVLTKDKKWIKLQKPRKSFEEMIRTELIVVHCFHYARRNPEASKKSVRDYLAKVFSLYDVKPSQNDLIDQMDLISEAVKRDDSLSKSKFLLSFLEENPRKRELYDEDGDRWFDPVCTLCDNGGYLICCDGCMRSFHASVEHGNEAMCMSLGITKREVDAMENFICKNCKYKQHQCFACGELGSSDKSSGAQVFRCANATCSYFYHPHCIAKLLYQQDGNAAKMLEKKIVAGEDSFTCPIHKCCVCKQGENKRIKDLQFAICRRCPTSYHRKCLPSDIFIEKITKEGEENEEEEWEIRGWENLLPNRVLIYCLEHEIDDEIGIPISDIKFPKVEEKKKKKKKQISELPGRNRKQHSKDKTGIATTKKLLENRQNSEMPPRSDDSDKEIPHYSPLNMAANRSSQEGPPIKYFEIPADLEMGESNFPDIETGMFNPHLPYGRAYKGAMNGVRPRLVVLARDIWGNRNQHSFWEWYILRFLLLGSILFCLCMVKHLNS